MIASLPVERSECTEESVAELAGCSREGSSCVPPSSGHQRCRREAAIDIGALNRRVADLEIESASRKGAAFVFIKPQCRDRAGEGSCQASVLVLGTSP